MLSGNRSVGDVDSCRGDSQVFDLLNSFGIPKLTKPQTLNPIPPLCVTSLGLTFAFFRRPGLGVPCNPFCTLENHVRTPKQSKP